MATINDKFFREIRCPNCHRLLGYEFVFAGRLAFGCPRCGELCEFNFKHTKTKENVTEIEKQFSIGSNINTSQPEGGE